MLALHTASEPTFNLNSAPKSEELFECPFLTTEQKGLDTLSTLSTTPPNGSATQFLAPEYRYNAPVLEPPQLKRPVHFMKELIDCINKVDITLTETTKVFTSHIETLLSDLQMLQTKKIEGQREQTAAIAVQKNWGVLETVTDYVASISTLLLGISYMPAVGLSVLSAASAFLIAAGGLGLVNRFLSDTGLWDVIINYFDSIKLFQLEISEQIRSYKTTVSVGLAMAAAIGLFFQMKEKMSKNDILKGLKVIESPLFFASTLLQVIFKMGKTIAEYNIAKKKEQNKKIDTKLHQLQQEFKETIRRISDVSENIAHLQTIVRKEIPGSTR